MGRIKIKFISEGKDVFQEPFGKGSIAQQIQRKHNTSKIEELNVPEDIIIELDVNDYQGNIEWEKFEVLDEETAARIGEIEYYANQALKLGQIIEDIRRCTFENRHEIERLGHKALEIVQETQESMYFPDIDIRTVKAISSSEIGHTIGKEVEILISHVKNNTSEKKKFKALNAAQRRLASEINSFKIQIETYNVN